MNRDQRLIKLAQVVDEMSDPKLTGKTIAEIILFMMKKINFEKRPHSLNNLRQKLLNLNEMEMSSKKSPPSSAIGNSIAFIKNILNGREPMYIRSVISEVVKNL